MPHSVWQRRPQHRYQCERTSPDADEDAREVAAERAGDADLHAWMIAFACRPWMGCTGGADRASAG
ncbi:hypothetical protein [Actinopolymorpha pittospori]|uniref:Uncharacterized protein n=1 Tax=Actinopolymorpha pittospori TaxID=648752 RepID=A0A927RMG7_9ACTN|nr:hypothetical protein [Actinopolymorpha pittospori]MBE1608898.1 hypothetical protein [Actinopolymorpha pittospori]